MMGNIYSGALRVLTWLGTPDAQELSDKHLDISTACPAMTPVLAFDFVEAFADMDTFKTAIVPGYDGQAIPVRTWNLADANLSQHWEQLRSLLYLDYWKRLWIIQEFCLAKSLWVYYDKRRLEWKHFRCFHQAMVKLMGASLDRDRQLWRCLKEFLHRPEGIAMSMAWRLEDMIESENNVSSSRHGSFSTTLSVAVQYTMHALCSDPKDKIFGMLGLTNQEVSESIPVNYSQDLYQLYATVMDF
ncbi:hypothetical protein N431DRAFT_510631 [Stipitochalara longipes BDJ]|nr:hypothetical protein N431DRAFT_510631 [Stipitochalara longipes BDJ]